MTWHTIGDVSDTDVLDETDLQKYLDNLDFLHTPNAVSYEEEDDSVDFTTSSTSWASISADFELEITTVGERMLVVAQVVSSLAQLDIELNGVRRGNLTTGEGIAGQASGAALARPHLIMMIINQVAATHTLKLMWKATSGTATIYTAYRPRFSVRALRI